MAWQDEMIELLRVMVQDMADKPKYPDDSLERVLVGAAHIVEAELDFPVHFAADLANRDIVPDPTDADAGTRDDNFINLTCMRAAAIIDQGSIRAESGIVIRDNGSMVDLHYKLDALVKMVQGKGGWASEYQDAKLAYQAGLLTDVVGAAVLGPFRDLAGEYYGWDGYYPDYRGFR
jgi:hypothetical protein